MEYVESASSGLSVFKMNKEPCVENVAVISAPATVRSRFSDRGARMVRLALWIALLAPATANVAEQQDDAVPRFDQLDSMQARVQGCVTCHGQRGQGTSNGYYPRIAGKPAGYLYNQLLAFKDGTRKYPPMNYLVAYLPEEYLRKISEHYAAEQPPLAQREARPGDASSIAHGQTLVTSGDFARGIPACTICHGERLTGREPGIPGLVGLRPTYIAGQLVRWQVGDRHAIEPDCMKRISIRLSADDISAVAAWLSRLEAPKDMTPESSAAIRMPLACGSQPAP
jgi:cytochrome c553